MWKVSEAGVYEGPTVISFYWERYIPRNIKPRWGFKPLTLAALQCLHNII
jgi:hypothetical protein